MKSNYLNVVRSFLLTNKVSVFITLIFIIQTLIAGRSWISNLFSFIPPIFFTLLFFFLLFWNIAKEKKYGLIFVAICLPMAMYSSDISLKLFSDQPSANSETIKIFNWNTQFWEGEGTKAEFFNYLLSQNADVYHLQEHITFKDGKFVELDDLNEIKSVFKGYKVIHKTEFLTITKLPVVKSFEDQDSYYLRVDVEVGKNIVSLYNVHIPVHIDRKLWPDIFGFVADIKDRFDFREREYNKLIEDIKTNNNEFYISGDFNTTRSMGRIQDVVDLGKDAVYAGDNLFNATWVVKEIKLWRIDYNIVHKGLKVLSYRDVDPLNYSDHWAQLVTVQL